MKISRGLILGSFLSVSSDDEDNVSVSGPTSADEMMECILYSTVQYYRVTDHRQITRLGWSADEGKCF
jgi:hypothetical protein